MAAVGSKVILDCPYGCRVKLTEPLCYVVQSDGSMELVLDADAFRLAQYAHMVGMHS